MLLLQVIIVDSSSSSSSFFSGWSCKDKGNEMVEKRDERE